MSVEVILSACNHSLEMAENQLKISFGTSGARGLVEQFTDEACCIFTTAFLQVMQDRHAVHGLAIAIDRRPSSPSIAAACAAAAQAMGIEVSHYGVIPTPALALQAMRDGVPAIMITGSHIPFDRNGIKFYTPHGEITKADEQAILAAMQTPLTLPEPSRLPVSTRAADGYRRRYLDWFAGQPLAGWRVGLYEHSSAGRDLNREILAELGAEVVSLGRSEVFVPIDTEAVREEDRVQGIAWAQAHRLDALLSTDGDGDRPLLADERGQWLRGDIVGLLCARELGMAALAVPVSCNTAIEQCGAFCEVSRTRIGSPHVIEGMQVLAARHARVAGFEANGGFLLGSELRDGDRVLSTLPTRDALLPALTLMVAAARRGCRLSDLAADLPQRYTASDRLQDFPTERSRALLAQWQTQPEKLLQMLEIPGIPNCLDSTDGLRITLDSGEIVHLRPSGNAPELRCYAEAGDEQRANGLVEHCLQRLACLA